MKSIVYLSLCSSLLVITNHAAQAAQRRRVPMELSSSAFREGQPIPLQFTGYGQDISPRLEWSNVPEGTKSFVLIVGDPDAPISNPPFIHWVVYDIPGTVMQLQQGVNVSNLGARLGMTSFGSARYGGPKPPQGHGIHHYQFTLYALDTTLSHLPAGMPYKEVLNAMNGHVLAEAELVGTYEKK